MQREQLDRQMKSAVRKALAAEQPKQPADRYPVTPDELRDCEEWRSLSQLMRDERPNCERCGIPDDLHVHHVEPLWKAPHRLLDVTNLRVLCSRCHAIVEPMVRRPQTTLAEMHPIARQMAKHKTRAKARHVTGKRPPRPGSNLR